MEKKSGRWRRFSIVVGIIRSTSISSSGKDLD